MSLTVGQRVIASCPLHKIIDQPGTIDAPINKSIYPTGHGDWAVKFDHWEFSSYGCDESDIKSIEA